MLVKRSIATLRLQNGTFRGLRRPQPCLNTTKRKDPRYGSLSHRFLRLMLALTLSLQRSLGACKERSIATLRLQNGTFRGPSDGHKRALTPLNERTRDMAASAAAFYVSCGR